MVSAPSWSEGPLLPSKAEPLFGTSPVNAAMLEEFKVRAVRLKLNANCCLCNYTQSKCAAWNLPQRKNSWFALLIKFLFTLYIHIQSMPTKWRQVMTMTTITIASYGGYNFRRRVTCILSENIVFSPVKQANREVFFTVLHFSWVQYSQRLYDWIIYNIEPTAAMYDLKKAYTIYIKQRRSNSGGACSQC